MTVFTNLDKAPLFITDSKDLQEKGGCVVCVKDENGKYEYIYGEEAKNIIQESLKSRSR